MIFWLCGKNGLIRNIGFNFKIYDVTTYISRNKGNQTMKFGQVTKYSKRNNFLQISCRKRGRESTWGKMNLAYNKNLLHKTFDKCSILIFEKWVWKVSRPHSVYDFQIFFMLSSINWPKFFDWLPIAVVCFPDFDVINFEINLIFLTKPFFYMTKRSRQKFKYLENEIASFLKSFQFPKLFLDLRVHL